MWQHINIGPPSVIAATHAPLPLWVICVDSGMSATMSAIANLGHGVAGCSLERFTENPRMLAARTANATDLAQSFGCCLPSPLRSCEPDWY